MLGHIHRILDAPVSFQWIVRVCLARTGDHASRYAAVLEVSCAGTDRRSITAAVMRQTFQGRLVPVSDTDFRRMSPSS